jgi:hypothetical protein
MEAESRRAAVYSRFGHREPPPQELAVGGPKPAGRPTAGNRPALISDRGTSQC